MDKKDDKEVRNVLVKFTTKQEQYSVPGTSVSLPANLDTEGLNKVVKQFLRQGGHEEDAVFDFLLQGEFLVLTLEQHLEEKEISFETLIELEFLERRPPPRPQESLQHDDWVAAVHGCGDWILTGCYDSTLHLWDAKGVMQGLGDRALKLTIPAHHAPIKSVSWVHQESDTKSFISTSLDQTAMLWIWKSQNNSIECVSECRGHTQSVECVAVDPSKEFFATGSWDNMLKIWSAAVKNEPHVEHEEEPDRKKRKKESKKARIKTPVATLAGHTENVGGVVWTNSNELTTASWDHTLRMWDADIGGMKTQINGNVAFFCLSWSPLNNTIIAGCADRHVRLYDPRSTGSVVQQKFTSHTKWIPTVKWSSDNQYHFISGGYDNLVKLWDSRSPKAPLFDMTGHEDKILCVDWSYSDHMISGSADCTVKVFASEKRP